MKRGREKEGRQAGEDGGAGGGDGWEGIEEVRRG